MSKTKTPDSRDSSAATNIIDTPSAPVDRMAHARAARGLKKARKPPKKDRHGRRLPIVASQDKPMSTFITHVPQDEFTKALAQSEDAKFVQMFAARCDPAYRELSFSALCRKFGVTLQDVDDLWRKHQLHVGMLNMMNHVPKILDDVAGDAESRFVCCPRCDGDKHLTTEQEGAVRTCPVCEGEGKVKIAGDKYARDLVFETIQLIGKRVPQVAIQQNNFGMNAGLEDVLLQTQKLITGGQ